MSRKGSSGRRKSGGAGNRSAKEARREIQTLREWAKRGEMPRSVLWGGSTKRYNHAFEAINRYYEWPSEEYLRANGVDMSMLLSGWQLEKDIEYRGWQKVELETYHMKKTIAVRPKNGKLGLQYLYSPVDATPRAREGMMKYALYAALRQAKVLDKEQFIVRE